MVTIVTCSRVSFAHEEIAGIGLDLARWAQPVSPHVGSEKLATDRVDHHAALVPIEHLRVGDRVVADNPECATDHIDASSQTVTIHLDDGSAGAVVVETIRPSAWLDGDGLATRGRAWVDLSELKVSGWGTIIHVGPAPPEQSGDGCLVLTTVNQVADHLLRLRFAETADELELTPSHPLYVEGRGWVAAQELTKGDALRAESGRVTVLAVERVAGQRVYDLEVRREHSYRVLRGGVWAHNECGGGGAAEGVASNAANAPRLAVQLARQEAESAFTATGELSQEAIQGARQIIKPGRAREPSNPERFREVLDGYIPESIGAVPSPFLQEPINRRRVLRP